MREIKFRGKSIVNVGNIKIGDWIIGGIVYDSDRVWIDIPYYGNTIVDKETVGQFTGLKDKNGKEIYEGDILSLSIYSKKYGVIKWNDNLGGFYIYKIPSYTLKYANRYEVVRKYLG